MGSWLDRACYEDPQRIIEQREVESASWDDYHEMRRLLMEHYGWQGWNKRGGRET